MNPLRKLIPINEEYIFEAGTDNMKRYLETITHRDFQTKMVMAGHEVGGKSIPSKPIPDWLYLDLPPGVRRQAQNRGQVIKIMASDIKKQIAFNGSMRAVITPEGDFFCCNANDYIHGHLIAYAMLVGAIPEASWMSNYQWSDKVDSADYFLALAFRDTYWGLAESYTFEGKILHDFKKHSGLWHTYSNPLYKVGIDIEDINTQVFL